MGDLRTEIVSRNTNLSGCAAEMKQQDINTEAYKRGKEVFRLLRGYTTIGEQFQIGTKVYNLDEKNINQFFKGYNDERKGDKFFKQLLSEYNFCNKQDIMLDVVKKYKRYLEENTLDKKAEIIFLDAVLGFGKILKKDCDTLDKITSGGYI